MNLLEHYARLQNFIEERIREDIYPEPPSKLHTEITQQMIERVNKLYDEGNTIYIYTARGMGQYKGDLVQVYNNLYVLTLDSLTKWGIKHHGLIMGKLHYDYLIDDKAMSLNEFSNSYK